MKMDYLTNMVKVVSYMLIHDNQLTDNELVS